MFKKKEAEQKPEQKNENKIEYRAPLPFQMLKTEKGTMLQNVRQYIFKFSPSATKNSVRKTIAEAFSVHPISVHMINVSGKKVGSGRNAGTTKNWKKAIVKLKEGEKIEVK